MNQYDVIVLVIVGGLGVLGFWRGFIREIIETIGAVVAALLTYKFSSQVAGLFGIGAQSGWVSRLAVIVGLFVVLMVIISLIGYFIRRFVRKINLGLYDHLLGLVLGAVKGGVLVAVLVSALLWLGSPGEKIISESALVRANMVVFDIILDTLPDSVRRDQISALTDKVTDKLNQPSRPGLHRIPISLVKSLVDGAVDKIDILGMIRSMGSDAAAEDWLEGRVDTWNAESARGSIVFFHNGDEREIACFFGSLADGRLATTLQAGDSVRFQLVFSEFLNQVCADGVATIGP